jgi:hypothetical protein
MTINDKKAKIWKENASAIKKSKESHQKSQLMSVRVFICSLQVETSRWAVSLPTNPIE